MDLAIQLIANDKTVGSDRKLDLKLFYNQFLTTQAKKGEKLVSMMLAIKKAFPLLGDEIIEISTENIALKDKIDSYGGKWLEKSKAKLFE